MNPMLGTLNSVTYPRAMLLGMTAGEDHLASFDIGDAVLSVTLTQVQFYEVERFVMGEDGVFFDLEVVPVTTGTPKVLIKPSDG